MSSTIRVLCPSSWQLWHSASYLFPTGHNNSAMFLISLFLSILYSVEKLNEIFYIVNSDMSLCMSCNVVASRDPQFRIGGIDYIKRSA